MDAVNAFNMELFSLIDLKPPISRAKMMSVTKSAIKAIKFYKHVVQIVEKFIKKCKPELKVPGLYVIDSIVRQSRHQFGVDKDVFGPRFLKNITDTFQNLYLCPEDDKSKIVRVLNLWQRNGVFDMDITQRLLDMATGSFVPASSLQASAATAAQPELPVTSTSVVATLPQLSDSDALAAVAQLFQSSQAHELQKMLQTIQQGDNTEVPTVANSMPAHPQIAVLNPYDTSMEQKNSLAKNLLNRFGYDDEPEEKKKDFTTQSLVVPGNMYSQLKGEMLSIEYFHHHMRGDSSGNQPHSGMMQGRSQMMAGGNLPMDESYSHPWRNSREDPYVKREGRHKGFGRTSRSRSRSPRMRRSRSPSFFRRSRHWRSWSEELRGISTFSRSPSQNRDDREKHRERRQKGLPSIKSQTLSICSTTLWVGQLDKKTTQADVMSLLEEFGQIESINMIPPRGCAYIVMVHRQDAFTALHKLSSGFFKVNQKPIKIAWALNKGIKAKHKKFWDVEQGVTYIPWTKVKVEELDSFREGGMLDTDTLNPEWNDLLKNRNNPSVNGAVDSVHTDRSVTAVIQVLPGQKPEAFGGLPTFSGTIGQPSTSVPPGRPAFMPTRCDPTKTVLGFAPARVTISKPNEAKDDMGNNVSSDSGTDNQLGSPSAPLMSPPGAPLMSTPGLAVLQAPRPGMPSMQSRSVLPSPHLPTFLPAPNMLHMPPQILAGGPVFPPDRFRMSLHFHPRGFGYPPRHPVRLERKDDREGMHFPNGKPGFRVPPYQRGRW